MNELVNRVQENALDNMSPDGNTEKYEGAENE